MIYWTNSEVLCVNEVALNGNSLKLATATTKAAADDST